MMAYQARSVLLGLSISACDFESLAPDVQGVDTKAPDTCASLAVVQTNYVATSIAAVNARGNLLSPALLSSLPADVVFPHDPPAQGSLVVIERYPAGALTWVDPARATVLGQLRVSDGFPTNPHDYVEVDARRALVSRYGANPGTSSALNAGNDLLVVDRIARKVEGRVDLADFNGMTLARPDRMTRIGHTVYVVLGRLSHDFQRADDGLMLSVDTKMLVVDSQLPLGGLRNCVSIAVSPSAQRLAIGCSGLFRTNGANPRAVSAQQREESGIAVIDVQGEVPVLERVISFARELAAVGLGLSFASEDTVLATTYGDKPSGLHDAIVSVSVRTGAIVPVYQAADAFVLGDIACPCPRTSTASCLYTDAARNSVQSLTGGASLSFTGALSPRALGGFYP